MFHCPRRCLRIACAAWLLTTFHGLSTPAAAAETRTWTDSSGKYKIEASLVGVENGTVTLKQSDGEEIEIPLVKLSAADQDYIKKQDANNPFKTKGNNPFAPKPSGGRTMPATEADSAGVVDDSGAFDSRLVNLPTRPIQPIALINRQDGWQVDAATLVGTVPEDHTGKPIALAAKSSFFEKVTGVALNAAGTHAAVGYKWDQQRDSPQTRVVIADLKSGEVIADRRTGGALSVRALSDDVATVVMCRDEFGFGKSDRLELWNVSDAAIRKGAAWMPFDGAKGGDRDVLFAEFSADGQLLTASAGGQVIAWSLNPLKAEWTCQSAKGCRPALAPSRKHLLVAEETQLCLLELAGPRVIAAMPVPRGAFPKLSFSPKATRFGVMTQSGGTVFETATGAKFRDIEPATLPSLGPPQAPLFVNEEQALFGEQYLLDLPSLVPIWQYREAEAAQSLDGAVWYVKGEGDRAPGVLFGARLPHPGATAALEKALEDPNYFVVKPGTTVKLNLDSLPDQAKREEARQAMTANLAKKEIRVDPAAAVEIVCTFDAPKDENIIFHGFGGMEAVDFKETVARIAYKFEGQQLWQSSASNRPFMVNHARDESLQDAIRKYEAPNYGFFGGANLPRMLVHPSKGGGQTIGSSRVTTTGIR